TIPVPSGQPIQLTATTTVKVRGMLMTEEGQPYQTPKGDYIYSDVVSATFTKVAAPVAPEFTPVAGEYYDSVVVSIACATENVMIKYQFGGTEPMGMSPTYVEPFKLTETTVVSAMAFLVDSEGAPIMDVDNLPIASQATFAQYIIKPKQGVDVDNVEVAAIVYAKDGMVYVDTEIGTMIEVFTVQGQRIYAAEATTQLTTIDAYAADVVLVRVNGETVKVAVR
ncbi:MAG: chitobiase/beta-hexosaminidase C-terminal domain-containing protein, partial [Paludibacteraceae bacterium]|nr:chitobiase/beta-hexosaminidase C-terminal domain-containing protein [Paludibacteraceae bacterium]